MNYHITYDQSVNHTYQNENLVIFCHFDKNSLIDEHVVYYITNLHAAHCDIIFVSNCSKIIESEMQKIWPFVIRIILRENIGYDFGCYYVGYNCAQHKERYDYIIFANDSVYNFNSIENVFKVMEKSNAHLFGLTDSTIGLAGSTIEDYHIQSYFLSFRNEEIVTQALDKFFLNFQYYNCKLQIIEHYEEGLSKHFIHANLKTEVFCSFNKLKEIEMNEVDENFRLFKQHAKQNIEKQKGRWKVYVFLKRKEKFQERIHLFTSEWCEHYIKIKYFHLPFIKVRFLKSYKKDIFHPFFENIINKNNQFYNLDLINNHLSKVRRKKWALIKKYSRSIFKSMWGLEIIK